MFSLAAQPAVRLSWREASTASVSQESFIITYQRAESVSLSLWEVTKTPERKISGFKNRGLFCRNREADPKNLDGDTRTCYCQNDFEKEQIGRTSTTRFQNVTIKLYVNWDNGRHISQSRNAPLHLQPVDFAKGIQWGERTAFSTNGAKITECTSGSWKKPQNLHLYFALHPNINSEGSRNICKSWDYKTPRWTHRRKISVTVN